MEIVADTSLHAGCYCWHWQGCWNATVICKATFTLSPGTCRLADEPAPLCDRDRCYDDGGSQSVRLPSDLSPPKPMADVLLIGSAYSPDEEPVRSLEVRLGVDGLSKAVQVVSDRARAPDGSLHHGLPFVKMPLRYELAAGGPGSDNPVGIPSVGGLPDETGLIRLPNILPLGSEAELFDAPIAAVGFGPIAPGWPARAATIAGRSAAVRWPLTPLPEGFSLAFFNVAPQDQRLEKLSDTPSLVLENLHPRHPRLATRLPGVRPEVTIRRTGCQDTVTMTADTLLIDTDRGRCTLLWRGSLRLRDEGDEGCVTVRLKPPAAADAGEPPRPIAMLSASDQSGRASSQVPFRLGGSKLGTGRPPAPPAAAKDDAGQDTTGVIDLAQLGDALRQSLPFVPPAPVAAEQLDSLKLTGTGGAESCALDDTGARSESPEEPDLAKPRRSDTAELPDPQRPGGGGAGAPPWESHTRQDRTVQTSFEGAADLSVAELAALLQKALPFDPDAALSAAVAKGSERPPPSAPLPSRGHGHTELVDVAQLKATKALPFTAKAAPAPAAKSSPPPPPVAYGQAPPAPGSVPPPPSHGPIPAPALAEPAPEALLLLSLETYAAIKTALWRGEALEELLDRHEVDEVTWYENELQATELLSQDAASGSTAFARAVKQALERAKSTGASSAANGDRKAKA